MSAGIWPNVNEAEVGASCPYPALPPPINIELTVMPEHPCSYLPDQFARMRVLWAQKIPPDLDHGFMDAGFRRSGNLIYQPICGSCRRCLPIRIPVETFTPTKSQRRCARRNADLTVTIAAPELSDEKFALYRRYVSQWHKKDSETPDDLESFLYTSPVETLEFCYRNVQGELLAVGICDVATESLSSVYFYFDPAQARRSLGTFGVLREIEYARRQLIRHYYLGYWIDGCRSMEYKIGFGPNEVLYPDNRWRPGGLNRGQLERPLRSFLGQNTAAKNYACSASVAAR